LYIYQGSNIYICLISFATPSGRSNSHSSRSTAYNVSVKIMTNAKFQTSVMA